MAKKVVPLRGSSTGSEVPTECIDISVFQQNLPWLQARYYLVMGPRTKIFDTHTGSSLSHVSFKNQFGSELYKAYITAPDTNTIRLDENGLGFWPALPSGYLPAVNRYNRWKGFSIKPIEGECHSILGLVFYLCAHDMTAYDFVLKWLALPLQNPGTKMRSSICFHGEEGTGKNLLFEILKKIYGPYAILASEAEIEDRFNGWLLDKLLVFFNEVVSHSSRYKRKNILKSLTTESKILIDEKHLPKEECVNLANLIYASNEHVPLALDEYDRRVQVNYTPPKKEKSFYANVVAEIENGGVEAFYHYLLNLDLGNFTAFDEPPKTTAKSDLIELSIRSDARFIMQWQRGDVGLSLLPCLSLDIYKFYQAWCRLNGEKFAVAQVEFSFSLAKTSRFTKEQNVHYWDGTQRRKGTFFFHENNEQKPADVTQERWLEQCRQRLRQEAEDNGLC